MKKTLLATSISLTLGANNATAMQHERTVNYFIQISNTQPKLEVEVFIK